MDISKDDDQPGKQFAFSSKDQADLQKGIIIYFRSKIGQDMLRRMVLTYHPESIKRKSETKNLIYKVHLSGLKVTESAEIGCGEGPD